ncbi:hypothetical protein RHCRD62_10809 [Rhodococcus sp. RD6.2]|nr:hypothetical protein RHCRD62_10809 [Rhodococcus sp. RD6.2]
MRLRYVRTARFPPLYWEFVGVLEPKGVERRVRDAPAGEIACRGGPGRYRQLAPHKMCSIFTQVEIVM